MTDTQPEILEPPKEDTPVEPPAKEQPQEEPQEVIDSSQPEAEAEPEPEPEQQQSKEPSQEPQPLNVDDELAEITASAEDPDTVIRNGIPIPKDSELFKSIETSYNPLQNLDIAPSLLIKANLASLPLTLQAHETLPIRIQFLIHSIPLLDNIATQILRMIGVGPYEETLAIITSEEPTPEGLVYKDLVELFEQVKRVFSDEDPFLGFHNLIEDVDSLELKVVTSLKELEDPIDSAFRKSNLATFLLATLGSIEVGFFYLNESFLDVFCPTHNNGWFKQQNMNQTLSVTAGKLLKAQAALFLELKTQAYISALESGDRSKEEVLEDIFPDDLKDQLLHRRQTTELSPAEQDFLQRCKSRSVALLNAPDDTDLSVSYEWLIFLKELFNYVSKNIGFLIWGRKGRHSVLTTIGASDFDKVTPKSSSPGVPLSKDELQKRLELQKEKERELKERDARAAEELLHKQSASHTPTPQPQQRRTKPPATTNPPRLRHILRRPWSPEEESALIEALKESGPQWSKILELYGAGGSRSEALKNRTQVQLKDKARNWKMGFLKNKGEVPDYLAKVTGELGDDRSQKKRKRDTSTTSDSNKNNGDKRAARGKSPNVFEQDTSVLNKERERVVQQESNLRTVKESDASTKDTTQQQQQQQPSATPTAT